MDYLWTPWRYHYVTGRSQKTNCVFCDIAASDEDEKNLIVHRGQHNYVVLNSYPYNCGHVMVIPYQHVSSLMDAKPEVLQEMMVLMQRLEGILRKLYEPGGVNVGMNIGEAAGAGVASHIHMHVLPRWIADASFMSVVSETRVLAEELGVTWRRLDAEFRLERLPG